MRLFRSVVTIIALLLTALVPFGTSAVALTDPMYGAPTTGRCYDMSGVAVIASPNATTPTVSCAGQHTVMITKVVQLPASMTYDTNTFPNFLTKECLPSRVQASGGSKLRYGRSSYNGYVFIPTTEQQDQGAHWVTCLMGIAQGTSVLRITGRYPHVPAHPSPTLSFCMTRDFSPTNCAAAHKWHPVSSAMVTSAPSRIRDKAHAVCLNHFGRRATGWGYAWKMVAPLSTFVVLCLRS